jgi:hypothetical protein
MKTLGLATRLLSAMHNVTVRPVALFATLSALFATNFAVLYADTWVSCATCALTSSTCVLSCQAASGKCPPSAGNVTYSYVEWTPVAIQACVGSGGGTTYLTDCSRSDTSFGQCATAKYYQFAGCFTQLCNMAVQTNVCTGTRDDFGCGGA